MVDIGTAYISIVPETSQIAPGIRSALGGASGHADAAGRTMGSRLSAGLTKALKFGAASAGAAAVAGIGLSLNKGFQRLNAIDQAKAKLTALGNSGTQVDAIMKNALASVKGTAFGLGDAAGLAGTMVAAGIKPGKELESVLKTVADTAAIAGSDLGEMGSIFGKAAATGKLDGEVMAQLMDRQIGILPELAKHYKVTTAEASKMVSDGKVKFADFAQIMKEKVGGGAVIMGQTVQGAFENVKASLGRVGASALEPFFKTLPSGFGSITGAIDNLEPKVKALSAAFGDKVFNEWGPKLKDAMAAFKESGQIEKARTAFGDIASALKNIGPPIGQIVTELSRASAALGIGTWQLFLVALEAGAGFLNIINPLLSSVADLMHSNQTAVTLLLGAWLAFKTVPALMGRVTRTMAPLTSAVGNARTSVTNFGSAYRTSLGYVRQANPTISTAGAHMNVLRANMANAGAAAGGALKRGLGGVVGALGGPVGLGLTATLGVGMWALSRYQENQRKAAEEAQKHKARTDELTESILTYAGALDKSGRASITKNLQDDGKLDQLRANQGRGLEVTTEQYVSAAAGDKGALDHVNNQLDQQVLKSMKASESWVAYQKTMEKTGMTELELVAAMRGNDEMIAKWKAGTNWKLDAAIKSLDDAGREAIELGDAIGASNDEISDAAKNAKQLDDAMRAANPQLQAVADKMKGMGKGGKITVDTKEVRAARGTLDALGFKLKDLPDGKTTITAETESATRKLEVLKGDIALMGQLKANPAIGLDTVSFDVNNAAARTKLMELKNANVSPRTNLIIDNLLAGKRISMMELGILNRAAAHPKAKLDISAVLGGVRVAGGAIAGLNLTSATPTVTLNKEAFDVNDGAVRAQLEALKGQHVSPEVDVAIQKLLDGTKVSKDELDKINNAAVKAKADIDASLILEKIGKINSELNAAAVPRNAVITVERRGGNANGSITLGQYMNGGITQLEAFANGGFKQIKKPNSADIYQGRGDGTVFAEKETGGEAYIPLAAGKRRRSTDILATVAKMFGMELVPGDSISGMLGGIAGGAVTKLLNRAGADGLTRFADGGFSSKKLRDLAEGQGASQPLRGAPYVWGGVNWGDCSGAMSALTRAAVGLSPFGGRWSTGSAAADLSAMGFRQGQWTRGTMGVGFINDGPGGGHTAGTLPDGTNVEMGGSYGGGMVGGSVGANDGQFTDHWFYPVADDWKDPGSADGGYVNYPGGDGFDPAADPNSGGKGTSFSERLGGAASAFVGGQLSSLFGVLGINDSPGGLAALNEYENQRSQNTQNGNPNGTPSDPGTHKPAEGEDTGKGDGKTVDPKDVNGISGIKEAFKLGLRDAWRTGPEWDATDWIVNKESTWNPAAENGKYHGLIQAGAEVYKAAGVDPKTIDPAEQAKAYDKYVEGRYRVPTGAKAHWDQEGWYDVGGVIHEGTTLMKNGLGHKETALPFDPNDLKRSLDRGGDDKMLARLDRLIVLTERLHERIEGGGDTFNFPDRGNARDNITQVQRAKRVAKLAGV